MTHLIGQETYRLFKRSSRLSQTIHTPSTGCCVLCASAAKTARPQGKKGVDKAISLASVAFSPHAPPLAARQKRLHTRYRPCRSRTPPVGHRLRAHDLTNHAPCPPRRRHGFRRVGPLDLLCHALSPLTETGTIDIWKSVPEQDLCLDGRQDKPSSASAVTQAMPQHRPGRPMPGVRIRRGPD